MLDERAVESANDAEFVTAIVATLSDDLLLEIANCGHPSPLRFTGSVMTPLVPGRRTTPLGLFPDPVIERHQLSPGERLFFYSDGLFDTRDHEDLELILRDAFATLGTAEFDGAVERFLDQVEASASELRDDTTLVLVDCNPISDDSRGSVALDGRAVEPPWFRAKPLVG
jgi:serine/threonine protein phosphatase PrpC